MVYYVCKEELNVARNQELYDKIKEILIKKAAGYYYSEEAFEYIQKPPNKEEQLCFDDFIENKTKNGKPKRQIDQQLTLVKKKITSHYIPPDMLAIKILLENFGEKMNTSSLDQMSEKELIEYKDSLISNLNNLIKENKNDNWQMSKKRSVPHCRVQ